jgi:hypothetical protein
MMLLTEIIAVYSEYLRPVALDVYTSKLNTGFHDNVLTQLLPSVDALMRMNLHRGISMGSGLLYGRVIL